ncbi:unnamed protein product [Pleuronectes platessa]|uniref:Uncharacterized protein n=1 Tax=Pleuronectes platessa TaxID=8262 RepID=A0A9N7YAI5_PLEPL|nr:unnamed protein product [Pleuronectes platessa]
MSLGLNDRLAVLLFVQSLPVNWSRPPTLHYSAEKRWRGGGGRDGGRCKAVCSEKVKTRKIGYTPGILSPHTLHLPPNAQQPHTTGTRPRPKIHQVEPSISSSTSRCFTTFVLLLLSFGGVAKDRDEISAQHRHSNTSVESSGSGSVGSNFPTHPELRAGWRRQRSDTNGCVAFRAEREVGEREEDVSTSVRPSLRPSIPPSLHPSVCFLSSVVAAENKTQS